MFGFHTVEHKGQPLASREVFRARMGRNLLVVVAVVGFSLAVGATGCHVLGRVGWLDGSLDSAMILTGMGPVDRMEAPEGKLFAACCAPYRGLAFLAMVAVLVAPARHRFVHHFHLSDESDGGGPAGSAPAAGR